MRVVEQSESRLVLVEPLVRGFTVISFLFWFLVFLHFVHDAGWIDVLIPVVLVAGVFEYPRRKLNRLTLVLDRPADLVSPEILTWNGRDQQVWKLSDIVSVESETRVSSRRPRAVAVRPVMVLNNSQRVQLRPYHTAPGKTNSVVWAIQDFLGQERSVLAYRY